MPSVSDAGAQYTFSLFALRPRDRMYFTSIVQSRATTHDPYGVHDLERSTFRSLLLSMLLRSKELRRYHGNYAQAQFSGSVFVTRRPSRRVVRHLVLGNDGTQGGQFSSTTSGNEQTTCDRTVNFNATVSTRVFSKCTIIGTYHRTRRRTTNVNQFHGRTICVITGNFLRTVHSTAKDPTSATKSMSRRKVVYVSNCVRILRLFLRTLTDSAVTRRRILKVFVIGRVTRQINVKILTTLISNDTMIVNVFSSHGTTTTR